MESACVGAAATVVFCRSQSGCGHKAQGACLSIQESAADKRQLPWPASCRRWVAASHLIRQPSGTGRGPLLSALAPGKCSGVAPEWHELRPSKGRQASRLPQMVPLHLPKKHLMQSQCLAVLHRAQTSEDEATRLHQICSLFANRGPEARTGQREKTDWWGMWVRTASPKAKAQHSTFPSLLSPGIGNRSWHFKDGAADPRIWMSR
jgi:hypothetical protein